MRFTAETAAEYARRSHEARKAKPPEPPAPQPVPEPPQDCDVFTACRLSRVRAQLQRIDDMLLTEVDPQKLDRLASAQARLAEQERIMSGRPLPGSLRPSRRPETRSKPALPPPEPSEPTPMSGDADAK